MPGKVADLTGPGQWNTDDGWPYPAMQFKAALRDTTKSPDPSDPVNL